MPSPRAVAVATRPRLGAVLMAAVAPRVRVFDAEQLEVFFPIRPLFGQRRVAETGLDPSRDAAVIDPRLLHIVDVFVAGDGTFTERPSVNRAQQRPLAVGFHARFDQITHAQL